MYNAGWSHGKEKLKDDKPDLSKGCFYFNPIVDVPGSEEDRKLYPCSYPVNLWPGEDVIPGFEAGGKKLGCIMKDVVSLLATHIDDYVNMQSEFSASDGRSKEGEEGGYNVCMGEEMKHTEKVKGRLLYYFPHEMNHNETNKDESATSNNTNRNDAEIDSWIGWHNDSGFLTALAGDIYVDHDTGEIIPKDQIDPKAGLYIQDRSGHIRQICIPDDCMAIQIGECLQIVTGGHVVATPHCVRGADPNWESSNDSRNTLIENKKKRKVARISFPCFVDTVPSFPLTVLPGRTRDDVFKNGVVGCAKVPPLEER